MVKEKTRKKPELTPSQRQATQGDVTTWVGASAGTGKTHVLAARVLALMVAGTPPENILCLTYTRAAAAVMANRINEQLGKWAVEKETLLAKEIYRVCGHRATEEECRDARTLFARVLELPGGLKIQTIHSFCQTLLKRFPLEAGQSPHFQVMDERTTGEFLKSAIDDIMLASSSVPELGKAFDAISTVSTETRFEKLVQSFLKHRKQLKQLLKFYGNEENTVKAIYKALGVNEGEQPESVLANAMADPGFDGAALKKVADIIASGGKREKSFGQIFQNFLDSKDPSQEAFLDYLKGFIKSDGEPFKLDYVFRKTTLEANPEFEEIYNKEQRRLTGIKNHLALLQVAENTGALIHLSSAILYAFTRKKQAYGYLDYDDLVLVAEDLLKRPAVAEWILYKLDGHIDHILVDEAQDTNRVQWQLVEAISHEFTSGVGTRDEKVVRTVFAVGDIKQSIYRFQGAEPEEFVRARTRAQKRVMDAHQKFAHYTLDLSFRSTTAVLDTVDAVIAHPAMQPGIAETEKAIKHFAHRKGQSGLVEVWPVEQAVKEEDETEGWQLPLTQKFPSKADATLAAKIANKIHSMTSGKDMLESKGRSVRFGDILVLLRSRNDFLDHLVRELKLKGIPVAGSDRMILSEQLVIEDLLAMAKFALLPDDDYTLACILKSPLVGLDEKDLYGLTRDRQGSLWQALKKSKAHEGTKEYLSGFLGQADFITPFEFFSGMLARNDGRKKFIARLGPEINDPVDEFLALALEFERSHSPSLQGFLSWFDAAQTEVKRDLEQSANEVRIMTIHGAKGLEAPIVFLPDTVHAPKKHVEDLYQLPAAEGPPLLVWSARKEMDVGPLASVRQAFEEGLQEEHNRLLYVALTRAEDRLYISGWRNRNSPKVGTWYDIIRTVVDDLPGVRSAESDEGMPILRLQTKQTGTVEDDKREKTVQAEAVALKPWARKPYPLKETPLQDTPSAKHVTPDIPGPGDTRTTVEKGILIHELLEYLPNLDVKDREKAGRGYINMKMPDLADMEKTGIWHEVKAVLENPDFSEIFGPNSHAEVSIANSNQGTNEAPRPDRIIIKKDGILIVDFKSDTQVPRSQAEIPEGYKAKLDEYRTLVKAAYKTKTITTALLWTKACSLMEYNP